MSGIARKSVMVKAKAGSLQERENIPPVIDYAHMTRDELVDHFIDDNGLAQFIDTQQAGIDRGEWDWHLIARDLMAFSHYLQFSPAYLEELYDMQKGRQAAA